MKLTFNEQLALKVLLRLRHDGQNFENCRTNDVIQNFCENVLHVDPIELITRIVKQSETV